MTEQQYFDQFSGESMDRDLYGLTSALDKRGQFLSDELGIDERFVLDRSPLVWGDKALMHSEYMVEETKHG